MEEKRNDLWRPLVYLRAYPRLMIAIVVTMLISVAATLGVPQIVKTVINATLSNREQSIAILGGLAIVGLAFVQSVTRFLQGFFSVQVAEGLAYDVRSALFKKLQSLGFSYHDRADQGQMITRLTSDVDNIRSFTSSLLSQIMNTVLIVIASAVLLLLINWPLALLTFLVVPPMLLVLNKFQKMAGPLFGQSQRMQGMLISILQENITNSRVVRIFNRQGYEVDRFTKAVQSYFQAMMQIIKAVSWIFPLNAFLGTVATFLIIGVGGYDVITKTMSLGDLIAFNTYFSIMILPLFALGSITFQMASASASTTRVYEVMDEPADLAVPTAAKELTAVTGRITFDHVSFRYPGTENDIVKDVSFTVEPGQMVALVGSTGSGKSTLLHLLPRFYDVTEGRILLDGQDVREVSLEALRRQVVLVRQTTQLFRATIRENIAFGRPEATLLEIQEAARVAQAQDFIEALPQGYETSLGEGGSGLSGGQRQRLALARALLLRPPVLILDDSTSALDAATERNFMDALAKLPYPCTRLVISERPSTVERADQILVLEEGRITAQGSYQELLQVNRVFAALFSTPSPREVVTV